VPNSGTSQLAGFPDENDEARLRRARIQGLRHLQGRGRRGGAGCLTKPISATDLFATVERVRRELEAGSPLLLSASKEEVVSPTGIELQPND
jgi:hypothetical protein